MAKQKFTLGRGLDALISTEAVRTSGSSSIGEIEIKKIVANPNQPRQDFNEEALQELADSIKELGVIQPITLRKKDDGTYQIIAGERRYRASQLAGKTTIPAYILKADDEDTMEMALIENIQREDLNPLEIALAYQQLIEQHNLSQEQLSKRVGKGRATIANFLRLLKLPAAIQVALKEKRIDMGHAKALLSLDSHSDQLDIFHSIEKNNCSVREVVEGVVSAIQQMNKTIVEARDGVYNPPVIYEQRNLFNPSLGYGVFVMPAIILLIVQQTALIGVGMVSATRRERGELYNAESPIAITIGRTITYLAIYSLTLGFMLTVHYSLFDYPMRAKWWQCVAVIAPYLLAVIFLAQAVGALFHRRESSILWLLWLSIPFLLVSGVSLPPQAFPQWLYIAGKAIPSSSAVEAWIAIQSRGASLSDIAPQLTLLWVLVAVYGVLAIVLVPTNRLTKYHD